MKQSPSTPASPAVSTPPATPSEALVLCPYCGQATPMGARCTHCRGLFDPLSRQASQNAMGPWFIHDVNHPFRPGCSYETIVAMVKRAKIGPQTIIRGPTTRQFWSIARRTPGVANLLGMCHACQADVQPGDRFCDDCGANFLVETDRQHLGLAAVHLLPGQATAEEFASAGAARGAGGAVPVEALGSRGLQEAAAVRRVLERRLRTQRRVVALLFILMIVGVAAGVWAGFRFVPGSPLAAWFSDLERQIAGSSAPGAQATPPGPAPRTEAPPTRTSVPEVDAGAPGPDVPAHPTDVPEAPASPAPVPVLETPAAPVPPEAQPSAPPATDEPRGTWGRVQELVRRDTKESLAEAQTLLKGERPANVGKTDWDTLTVAVARRLEQLKLRGLP